MTRGPAILVGPGGWFYENSSEFLVELGCCDVIPDFDAARFAVANLGFARLSVSDDLLEVTIHTRNVEEHTLNTVQDLILRSKARLFRITTVDGPSQIVGSAREAIIALFEIYASHSANAAPC